MTATRDVPRLMAVTPVKPDRVEEFETFVRDVILPAVTRARPQTTGLWQLLRPGASAEASQVLESPNVATAPDSTYVFVFYGDVPLDDWDLGPVLTEVHGEEKGAALARQFEDFLLGDQVIFQFSGQVST